MYSRTITKELECKDGKKIRIEIDIDFEDEVMFHIASEIGANELDKIFRSFLHDNNWKYKIVKLINAPKRDI
jgi:hypothetical protein